MIANNLLLVVATSVVLLGTFYPLGLELITGARITVGPPYFDATFNPVMAILITLMAIGPVLAWRRGTTPRMRSVLLISAAFAIAIVLVLLSLKWNFGLGPLAAITLIVWLGIAILTDVWKQLKPFSDTNKFSSRIKRIPAEVMGMWIAHVGVDIFLIGADGEGWFRSEKEVRAKPGRK